MPVLSCRSRPLDHVQLQALYLPLFCLFVFFDSDYVCTSLFLRLDNFVINGQFMNVTLFYCSSYSI